MLQIEGFAENTQDELTARDGFFDSKLGGGTYGGGSRDGIGENGGAGLEALGGGTEGGPPTWASFFEEEEFGAVLGADEASGDDLGVIEDEEVCGGEEGGQIADGEIGQFACGATQEEESGGVAGVGGGGSDPIVRDGEREELI